MKNVALSDEAYEKLQRLAAARQLAPTEILSSLLETERTLNGDPLLFYLTSQEFSNLPIAPDRYLALLAWVAKHQPTDFSDFISHQISAHRLLRLNPDEVNAISLQHQTRQIDGTQYWAVMNIEASTQSRFVRRLLEFIGCHDQTVTEAIRALALPSMPSRHGLRLLNVA